jgi:hypothetical protein
MQTFSDFQQQDRRLVMLRALVSAAQHRTNAILLQRFLDSVGHVVTLDRIRTDLDWLAEQGLVEVVHEPGTPDVTVATLTVRGLDVAEGRTRQAGVARPKPGA